MIELKKNFSKYGDEFTQLYKKNGIAIYRRSNEHYDDVFEIFKIRVSKQDMYHEDMYERYPQEEAFGNWAWCAHGIHQLYAVLRQCLNLTKEDVSKLIECYITDSKNTTLQ